MVDQIRDPEVRLLAAISATLKGDYIGKERVLMIDKDLFKVEILNEIAKSLRASRIYAEEDPALTLENLEERLRERSKQLLLQYDV